MDIRKYDEEEYRSLFGVVFQDFRLLNDRNVYENVAFAQRIIEIPTSEIRRNVPTILATVGLAGKYKAKTRQLSGGEQQRIAIARAFIRGTKVLFLDEATSSVDTRTEQLIQSAMDRLMAGRTCFVIAHRLSTVRNANAIMVLENGEIIERGDHAELLRQKGRYYQLYTGLFELS